MTMLVPELLIALTAAFVLVVDLVRPGGRGFSLAAAALGTGASLLSLLLVASGERSILGGRLVVDGVGWWFKGFFLGSAILALLLSSELFAGRGGEGGSKAEHEAEYAALLLSTVLGLMLLVSARDLVTLYVSLELATIPLFLLAAWSKTAKSAEAGLKYVALGALASGIFLFGLGFIYGGAGGETSLHALRAAGSGSPLLLFGLALAVAGAGFKLALVPFHMWAPDVYEGAPAPLAAYLSVASKGGGLALLATLLTLGSPDFDWRGPVAALAAVTMTVGNLAALGQTNLRRFMAYSGISQAGCLLLGFLGDGSDGTASMLYYLLCYLVSNMAVFTVITLLSARAGMEEIDDCSGLSVTNPALALGMMLGLFSLAGIPPLAGFTGKFFLMSVAAAEGYFWLVGVAAVNGTVSLYYYLRIVRRMYIDPRREGDSAIDAGPVASAVMAICVAGALVLGIVPSVYDRVRAGVQATATP